MPQWRTGEHDDKTSAESRAHLGARLVTPRTSRRGERSTSSPSQEHLNCLADLELGNQRIGVLHAGVLVRLLEFDCLLEGPARSLGPGDPPARAVGGGQRSAVLKRRDAMCHQRVELWGGTEEKGWAVRRWKMRLCDCAICGTSMGTCGRVW